MALDALEAWAYAAGHYNPIIALMLNIVLALAWAGCLAVFFVWGGGLQGTGVDWVTRYHSFCIANGPPVEDQGEFIWTFSCKSEKILLIMLPFVCLSV